MVTNGCVPLSCLTGHQIRSERHQEGNVMLKPERNFMAPFIVDHSSKHASLEGGM